MPINIPRQLSATGKVAVIAFSFLWITGIGYLDSRLGFELSLSPFYWLVLCPAAWYCGAAWGYGLSFFGVAMAAAADIMSHPVWHDPWAMPGNTAARAIAFAALVWIIGRLRSAYDRETALLERSEAVSTLRSDLMSLLSHEIGNALTVLKMTVFMMEEGDAGAGAHRKEGYTVLNRVLLNLELASKNFLNNARIKSGRMTVDIEPLDAEKIIAATVQAFLPLLEQKRLALTTAVSPQSLRVLADRPALTLILGNLLGNAVKYTPEKGTIIIKAEALPEGRPEARISVSDTGIGISPEDKSKLMQAFVRLPEGKHLAHGSGLGLKNVSALLSAHGSALEIESTAGEGSIFSFVLPLAQKPANR